MIKVAIPVTCGHDIEVPERILNCIFPAAGDQAARMFSPGAAISGYKTDSSQGKGNLDHESPKMILTNYKMQEALNSS